MISENQSYDEITLNEYQVTKLLLETRLGFCHGKKYFGQDSGKTGNNRR